VQTEFAENGFYVLRGVLTEDEFDRLAGPIRAAFAAGTYDGFNAEAAYPQPGVYSMGPRILADHPEIAEVSLARPAGLFNSGLTANWEDLRGWIIHRKRAWTALLCGAHYDYIDFTINNYLETGTPESQRHIRTWMRHLSQYVHALDLVRTRPMPEIVRQAPQHTIAAVLAVAGEDYSIYLADARESDAPGAGETIRGDLAMDVPAGEYEAACFSPATGLYSPWSAWSGGPDTRFSLPSFAHDIVLRLRRRR